MESNIVGSDFTDFFFMSVMEWHTHDFSENVMVEAILCSDLNVCCCLLSKAHSWDSLCPVLPNRVFHLGKWLYIKGSIGTVYPVPTPLPHLLLGSQKSEPPPSSESYKRPPFATLTGIPPFRHPAMLLSVSGAGVWTVLKAPTPMLFPLCLSVAL